ncbi:hypothetical protein, partial [Microbacterium sp.]|uniref:hypothetical protein n=1 Tax=Microbacterium sp. TaxID=51671 RepID=UPI0039E3882C
MGPIGIGGAVLAVICAAVAAVAIMRGAGGLSGGAVGLWFPCALASSMSGFASQWWPLIVSGAVLVTALVCAAIARRVIVVRGRARPLAAVEAVAPVASAAPSTSPAPGAGLAR